MRSIRVGSTPSNTSFDFSNISTLIYLVVDIVLAQQTDRARFHTKVDILGDKNGFHIRLLHGQPVNDREYLMVGNTFRERIVHAGRIYRARHHEQRPRPSPNGAPLVKRLSSVIKSSSRTNSRALKFICSLPFLNLSSSSSTTMGR